MRNPRDGRRVVLPPTPAVTTSFYPDSHGSLAESARRDDVIGRARAAFEQEPSLSAHTIAGTSALRDDAKRNRLRPGRPYGRVTLQVPKGTNGRAGQAAVLLTKASTDCRALPATVESPNSVRRK